MKYMTDEDLKRFQKAIKDEVRPIKEAVEVIKNKVDQAEFFQDVAAQQVRNIKDQQSVMNEKLDGIEERLDGHGAALVRIESTLKGYGDMYRINNSNAKKLEKRVEVLEDNAGIEPPPELTLAEVR